MNTELLDEAICPADKAHGHMVNVAQSFGLPYPVYYCYDCRIGAWLRKSLKYILEKP